MKLNKKLIAAGVCAGLSLALVTGCAAAKPDGNATVATMDDTKLPLGVANLMYRYAQASSGNYISQLLGTDTATLWTQDLMGTGTPYGMTLKDSIIEEYKNMTILEQHMSEYDVEITDEDKAKISEAADQFIADNSKEVLEQMSGTKENVERLLTLHLIEDRMEKAIEASAEVEVTEEEAAQKKIRYAYFPAPAEETEAESEEVTEGASEEETTEGASEEETTEGASEEETTEAETESAAKAALREDVQGIIDEVLGGATLDDAVKAYDESKNIVENTYGANSTVSEAIVAAADTLSDGEIYAEPVEVERGFYIVEMVSTFDEEATASEMKTLEAQRRYEHYNEVLEGWAPEKFEVDEKVWGTVNYADDFHTPAPAETEEAVSEEASEEAVSEEETTEAASEETTEAASETETEAASETETESEA